MGIRQGDKAPDTKTLTFHDLTINEMEEGLTNLFSDFELLSPYTDSREIYENAMELFEKSKPKKLEYVGFGLGYGRCCNCGHKIDYDRGRYSDIWDFCPYCGQAIDWQGV